MSRYRKISDNPYVGKLSTITLGGTLFGATMVVVGVAAGSSLRTLGLGLLLVYLGFALLTVGILAAVVRVAVSALLWPALADYNERLRASEGQAPEQG